MASGQVTLRGRFSPGSEVRLVRVDGEHTLRAEGGEEIATKKVDDSGCVQFTTGVEVNARYFIVGQHRGEHVEVRARGRAKDDPAEVLENAPVQPDRMKFPDGTYQDERPEYEKPGYAEGAPHLGQQHIKPGTPQRSDTPRGSAHPVDVDEPVPYPSQEEEKYTKGKIPQMSDTPLGMATPLDLGLAQRQEDVPKGTPQRSDTPTGVATPIPQGGPVEAQQEKESSEAKAKRGEPGKVAAFPTGGKPPTGASAKASEKHEEEVREDREAAAAMSTAPSYPEDDTSGRDALGQPLAPDVAQAAGVEPAKRAAEDKPRRKQSSSSSSSSSKSKTSGSQSSGKSTSKEKK